MKEFWLFLNIFVFITIPYGLWKSIQMKTVGFFLKSFLFVVTLSTLGRIFEFFHIFLFFQSASNWFILILAITYHYIFLRYYFKGKGNEKERFISAYKKISQL